MSAHEIPAPAPSSGPDATIFELYKLAVDQADRVSSRRTSANSYFLTLQTGLAALAGLLTAASTSSTGDLPKPDDVALVVTAAIGVVLSITWWVLLRSYRELNAAKFKVICEIEAEHLPLRIFEREWLTLKADQPRRWWKGRYAELGFIERVVPLAFLAVYLGLVVRVFVS